MGRSGTSSRSQTPLRATATSPIWTTDAPSFVMPSGMPRPLYHGQPIPYTAAVAVEDDAYMGYKPDLKHIDETRMAWCVDMDGCLLCGEHVGETGAVVWDAQAGTVAEDGVMHDRCGRIALAHCPHLRDKPHFQLVFGPIAELVEHLKEYDWPNDKSLPASWTVLAESRGSRTA